MEAAPPLGGELISTFVLITKKRPAVLSHVANSIVFRWFHGAGPWVKTLPCFTNRAMRYLSCFERELAHVHETNDRCGTTHQRHSRSPRLEPQGVVTK